jgi:hypothetical protein
VWDTYGPLTSSNITDNTLLLPYIDYPASSYNSTVHCDGLHTMLDPPPQQRETKSIARFAPESLDVEEAVVVVHPQLWRPLRLSLGYLADYFPWPPSHGALDAQLLVAMGSSSCAPIGSAPIFFGSMCDCV